ncbi:hypothetical protein [Botryobacter ruber]|uniref:hypothetical protein n=1 Tax=Botryobacter ruber TaxID=2171629 RepID=UPI000E09EC79|nr:hypothetical protein [Botryobacter ruber]
MIQIPLSLPRTSKQKLDMLLQWGKLRQEQLSEAASITKDTIVDFIRRQAARGEWQEIQQVLRGKPMTKAARFMMKELRDKVVQKLIMRLGLRPIIAVAIAAVLLPLILAKFGGSLLNRVRNGQENP